MIILNQSTINFSYVLPDGQTVADKKDSNTVYTDVLTYSVSKVKSADKTALQEGETAVHTVVITNNSRTTLYDLAFKDNMSEGAEYVAGSVTVNGAAQPSYDPEAGFPLADLAAGQSVTVTYTVKANDPATATRVTDYATLSYSVYDTVNGETHFTENTNTVTTQIFSVRISAVKDVDRAFAVKGDILRYTTVIKNEGTLLKSELKFTDPIPTGTTFVTGSVKIDGAAYPAYDPQTGFGLPDLPAGESVTVEFEARVN